MKTYEVLWNGSSYIIDADYFTISPERVLFLYKGLDIIETFSFWDCIRQIKQVDKSNEAVC